jgi:hypothetical protein
VRKADPRGLKPIIRMTAAISTSFSGAWFVGTTLVSMIVDEPEGWRIIRYVAGVAFVITSIWSGFLLRQWNREHRDP